MWGQGNDGQIPVTPAQRTAAISALIVHLEAGRLSSTEYESRQMQADLAQTWAELDALFADLPAPHPTRPPMAHQMPTGQWPARQAGTGAEPIPSMQPRWSPERILMLVGLVLLLMVAFRGAPMLIPLAVLGFIAWRMR